MARLSLCMITRDEAEHLPQCLKSVEGLVDEIVIADTGSTDNTISIAERNGAMITQVEWKDDFSAARNTALAQCTGDWILHLDADEQLSADQQEVLLGALGDESAQALTVIVRNYHPPEDSTPFMDDRQIRLFRKNNEYQFEGTIHEQIGPSIQRAGGKIVATQLQVEHFGYQKDNRQKSARNLILIEKVLQREPDNAYILFKKGETLKALGKADAARRAFCNALDGKKTGLSSAHLELIYLRVAQLDLKKNLYPSARNWASKCLMVNPKNGLALYVRAVAALYLKLVAPAVTDLKALLQMGDKMPVPTEEVHKLLLVCQKLR